MPPPTSARAHGGVRGADLSRPSLLFGGPLGRVLSPLDDTGPKDTPDNEERGIPAAFTYLVQFVDHDLPSIRRAVPRSRTIPTRSWTTERPSSNWITCTVVGLLPTLAGVLSSHSTMLQLGRYH